MPEDSVAECLSRGSPNEATPPPIDPATQDEIERIWDEYETFIRTCSRGNVTRVHLPHPDTDDATPWCNGHGGIPTEWTEIDVDVYPVGYKELCRYCLRQFRAEECDPGDE